MPATSAGAAIGVRPRQRGIARVDIAAGHREFDRDASSLRDVRHRRQRGENGATSTPAPAIVAGL
jgi:hypothetical protein